MFCHDSPLSGEIVFVRLLLKRVMLIRVRKDRGDVFEAKLHDDLINVKKSANLSKRLKLQFL
jgi:hypothetical protein